MARDDTRRLVEATKLSIAQRLKNKEPVSAGEVTAIARLEQRFDDEDMFERLQRLTADRKPRARRSA